MTTTYGYVSLVRATMDNPEWGDEEGDLSVADFRAIARMVWGVGEARQ